MAIPTIPTILTKADWDKHKGIIAKIGVGETGVGAAMEKVRAAYTAVDWRKFDATRVFPGLAKTEKEVDDALAAARSEGAKVEKVRQELRNLEVLARKAEALFKSKPAIPKSSTEQAGKIAVAADHMAVALKSMDAEFATFEKMKADIRARDEMVRKALMTYIDKIQVGIRNLKSRPVLTEYDKFHRELVRGLAASVAHQKMTAFVGAWQKFSSDGYKPKKDTEIPPKLAEIDREVQKLKAAVA